MVWCVELKPGDEQLIHQLKRNQRGSQKYPPRVGHRGIEIDGGGVGDIAGTPRTAAGKPILDKFCISVWTDSVLETAKKGLPGYRVTLQGSQIPHHMGKVKVRMGVFRAQHSLHIWRTPLSVRKATQLGLSFPFLQLDCGAGGLRPGSARCAGVSRAPLCAPLSVARGFPAGPERGPAPPRRPSDPCPAPTAGRAGRGRGQGRVRPDGVRCLRSGLASPGWATSPRAQLSFWSLGVSSCSWGPDCVPPNPGRPDHAVLPAGEGQRPPGREEGPAQRPGG